MLKERNTRTGFLERDQIDRICAALEATETADDGRKKAGELANVVRFALASGWRTASEVLPLEWRHVDFDRRCVRLEPERRTAKDDRFRSQPTSRSSTPAPKVPTTCGTAAIASLRRYEKRSSGAPREREMC